jgi:hypothetical protein
MTEPSCSWCGTGVDPDDGFRLHQGARLAVFCRLEHVVPWAMRGASWIEGEGDRPVPEGGCAECEREATLVLVRHRGEHRIPDGFCSVEHAADWAKAGGRWR